MNLDILINYTPGLQFSEQTINCPARNTIDKPNRYTGNNSHNSYNATIAIQ